MEKTSSKKTLPFQDITERVKILQTLSKSYIDKKNLGMAKHMLILAIELLVENRKSSSLQDQQKREALAKILIPQAKNLKIQLSKKIENLKQSNPNFKDVVENLRVVLNKKIEFDDIIGQMKAKEAINEALILPSKRPEFFTGIRSPPKGKI